MTGQTFKRWTDASYVDEEGPSNIFKIEAMQQKCSLSSTSKLQLRRGFKVSWKPCLNLSSFKWLKWRHNLVKYLKPSGSLIFNIDLLLGLIKERSLLLKTTIDFKFCISGASYNHSDSEFGKKEYLKQSVLQSKKGLFLVCIIKAFTIWCNIGKVLRALSWQ